MAADVRRSSCWRSRLAGERLQGKRRDPLLGLQEIQRRKHIHRGQTKRWRGYARSRAIRNSASSRTTITSESEEIDNETSVPLLRKIARVKFERCWEMFGEVRRVMAAWVDVKFVRNLSRRQNFI